MLFVQHCGNNVDFGIITHTCKKYSYRIVTVKTEVGTCIDFPEEELSP